MRRGSTDDASLLAALGSRTFRDAFGADNSPADLESFLASTYGEAIQRRELIDPRLSYFIAEMSGVAAGFALVRTGTSPQCLTGPRPVELGRLYVDRPWHGTGVAVMLLCACGREALRRGGATLWLGVWERNPRAIRFYEKSGFRVVGTQTFVVGSDAQTDIVMECGLPLSRSMVSL